MNESDVKVYACQWDVEHGHYHNQKRTSVAFNSLPCSRWSRHGARSGHKAHLAQINLPQDGGARLVERITEKFITMKMPDSEALVAEKWRLGGSVQQAIWFTRNSLCHRPSADHN